MGDFSHHWPFWPGQCRDLAWAQSCCVTSGKRFLSLGLTVSTWSWSRPGPAIFLVKGQRVNISVFVGQMVSVVTAQLGHWSLKTATDDHKRMREAGFQQASANKRQTLLSPSPPLIGRNLRHRLA